MAVFQGRWIVMTLEIHMIENTTNFFALKLFKFCNTVVVL